MSGAPITLQDLHSVHFTRTAHLVLDIVMTAIHSAETRAIDLQARFPTLRQPGSLLPFGTLDDHRAAVAGDLAEALDRIAPGLGMRFMQALHPELDLAPREGEPL